MAGKDPLEELFLDAAEVNKTRLAKALKTLLGIDTDDGTVVLKPGFTKLTARQKIIAYLLGRKASVLLGKKQPESSVAKEIQEKTGLPQGTARPRLRDLLDEKIISQAETGEYFIAPHQIEIAIQKLELANGTSEEETE